MQPAPPAPRDVPFRFGARAVGRSGSGTVPYEMKRSAKLDAAPGEAARVGEELRDARLALGWTVDELAERLRINRRYLAALEEGRSRDLPAQAYALGFVRSYARALGLDADDLVRRFRDSGGTAARSRADLVFPEPVPERGVPPFAIVLLGLCLVGGVYAGVWMWSGGAERSVDVVPPVPPRLEQAAAPATPPVPAPRPAAPAPAPPLPASANPPAPPATAAPRPAPAATPAPAAGPAPAAESPARPAAGPAAPAPTAPPAPTAGTVVLLPGATPPPAASSPPAAPPPAGAVPAGPAARILLRASDESWVQVRDARSGEIVLNRVLRAGESWPVPGRDGLLLTTGRAQALEVLVDGQPSPAMAGRGGVIRDIALDPERLRTPR
jgi:cytoskeleton protein RodZ